MFGIVRGLKWGLTAFKSGRKWGSVVNAVKSPASRNAFRWFWRAIDITSIGLIGYDIFSDKGSDSLEGNKDKFAEDNLSGEMLIDSILSEPVRTLLAVPFEDTDEDAMRVLYARAGTALFAGQGNVPHSQGLSLVMVGEYKSQVGNGYAYALDDLLRYCYQITNTAAKDMGASSDELKKAFEEIAKNSDETMGELGRRNADYLVWMLDIMSDNQLLSAINKTESAPMNVLPNPTNYKNPILT